MTKMRQAANELEQAATPGNPPRSRGEPYASQNRRADAVQVE